MVASNASRSGTRDVSTSILLVSIGRRRMVASIMMPVRPIPPMVAQNNEGLRSGPTTVVEPSASIIVIASRWLPIEPST